MKARAVAGTPNIFASGGPQSYLPGDYRFEKGTAALDVRHRLVFSGIWQPTFTHSIERAGEIPGEQLGNFALLGVFTSAPAVTPTVQISSAPVAAPFSAAFTGTLNGYSSTGLGNRVPFQPLASIPSRSGRPRSMCAFPSTFPSPIDSRPPFTFDAFNVFNHRFFTSVNQREYVASGNVLTYQSNVGQGTASQGFPDGTNARRLQIGLRFTW